MKVPRITMRDLIVAVVALGVDFAWVRRISTAGKSLCGLDAPAFDIGILWMVTILSIQALGVATGRFRKSPFQAGFALGGLLGLAVFAYFGRWRPDEVRSYLNYFEFPAGAWLDSNPHADRFINIGNTILLFLPELALAILGGFVLQFAWSARRG